MVASSGALLLLGLACTSTPSPTAGGASTGPSAATVPIGPRPNDEELARSGGAVTVVDVSTDAFARSAPELTAEERRAFAVGNNFFNDNWVTAPASTDGRDGLGPIFNAQSCSSCHFKDGRGQPPVLDTNGKSELGLLLRLSVPGPDGTPIPDPVYGGQLQDKSINGVPAEGTILITTEEIVGRFDDGTVYVLLKPSYAIGDPAYGPPSANLMISPRVAPPVFGVGLLEAIPAATILALADPDDRNGDGISGSPNYVLDPRTGERALGRFGWKSNAATVEAQVAGAFRGDIGIGSTLATGEECTSVQAACLAAPSGGSPELDDQKLGRVVFYNRTLAVPARRDVAEPNNRSGEELFASTGCSACHTTELRTGANNSIAVLAGQVIRPYTDLLLHDMGEGLADNRPDGEANGMEWRTAPLWGIGLTGTVNRHTRFLHDGRARSVEEAILWHGGEAAGSQQRYVRLSADDRRKVLSFLESL